MQIDLINLAGIGAGIVAIGTLLWTIYERRRSGASNLRHDIDEDNKMRRDQLEERVRELGVQLNALKEDHSKEMSKLHSDLAAFKATIVEKDKHIASLTSILQGRNPEMISLLEGIKNHLLQSQKILDYQTSLLEKGDKRSSKIDKASNDEDELPIRVPESK